MLITVRHVTRYTYDAPVNYTVQSLRLTPAPFKGQHIVDWHVRVPGCSKSLQFEDGFGNTVDLVSVYARHAELIIEAGGTVETSDCSGVVAGLPKSIPPRVFLKETEQTRPDSAIRDLARSIHDKDPLDKVHALAGAVRDRIDYVAGITDTHTGAAAALADGKGVCQDHAHVFISAARTLGIPARYITGYLVMDDAQPADAHHAWAEAWIDPLGWVAFDIANRVCPTDAYVRLAAGLDAGYAAPVIGSRRGGAGEKLDVSVAVQQQSAQQ
jgi:transglutaminase-like putative cysteine protease